MRSLLLLFLFFAVVFLINEVNTRKVTQKPNSKPTAPKSAPKSDSKPSSSKKTSWFSSKKSSDSKPDKSWARSMIDSAKNKYDFVKTKIEKKLDKPHTQQDPNAPIPPTKKSVFERAKEKFNKSGVASKAIGFVKKDLGIGVEGPKKPSKILNFGKKAVAKLFSKKRTATGSQGNLVSQESKTHQGNPMSLEFHRKVDYLKEQLLEMQHEFQETWNTSEAGTKYALFEEKKNWNDAQLHCEHLGSHLAYLDSQSKNQYATLLLNDQNISHVWFGLRTDVTDTSDSSQEFTNFGDLNGCGVLDQLGSWSISSCSMELPFLCQAFRFNAIVEIPLSNGNPSN